jgi:hypothetical protein
MRSPGNKFCNGIPTSSAVAARYIRLADKLPGWAASGWYIAFRRGAAAAS